jgi:DNA-binding beta-propeller fold protein YncE
VPRTHIVRSAVALAAVIGASAGRAQAPTFVPAAVVYEDDKGRALKDPEGVACGDGGLVVVADTGNGRLVRLKFDGGQVTGGTEVRVGELSYPTQLALDGKGNVLVLDRKLRKIGRVSASGAFAGFVEVKGTGPEAVQPAAFKVDGQGNLVVLDGASMKVLVVDAAGAVTRQLDLPKRPAFFTDVAVDSAGTIYALDAVGGAIYAARRGEPALAVLVKGLKENASFTAHLTAYRGRLYVVDQNGSGLLVLGPDGSYQGRQLSIGWTDGLVYYPAQLCIGDQGEAVIADRGNSRVQIFSVAK